MNPKLAGSACILHPPLDSRGLPNPPPMQQATDGHGFPLPSPMQAADGSGPPGRTSTPSAAVGSRAWDHHREVEIEMRGTERMGRPVHHWLLRTWDEKVQAAVRMQVGYVLPFRCFAVQHILSCPLAVC